MGKSTKILDELNREEKQEAAEYIAYRRKLAINGCSPVIAARKGKNTLILENNDNSIDEFVDILLQPDMLVAQKKTDPLLAAKLRGVKAKKEMLSTDGEPWSSKDVAQYLNLSLNTISKQRRSGKLLGLHCGQSGYRFPSWQFQSNEVLPGLNEVLKTLNNNLVPDWDKLRFFITTDYALNHQTPLFCLRSGMIENTVQAAKSYGVHGAS